MWRAQEGGGRSGGDGVGAEKGVSWGGRTAGREGGREGRTQPGRFKAKFRPALGNSPSYPVCICYVSHVAC